MVAQRLNNRIRNRIKEHMIDDKFSKAIEDLNRREEKIANLAYHLYLPPARRKIVNSLPRGMFPTSPSMVIAVQGEKSRYAFSKDPANPDERAVGYELTRNSGNPADILSINLGTAEGQVENLARQVLAHRQEWAELKEERSEIKNHINAVLASVNTRAKLIEEWPEIEPTLDRIYPLEAPGAVPTRAIAVKLDHLNATLNLPEAKPKTGAIT